MLEQQYDTKILRSLIAVYKELEGEITLLGEDTLKEHSSGLLQRQDTLKNIIVKYAQLYCEGFAYAEHMSVSDIEEITINHKK